MECVNYYSLDYSDVVGTELTQGLNQALSAPAAAYDAVEADVFSAFQAVVSNPYVAGKTCVAGLLNASPQSQLVCDVPPCHRASSIPCDETESGPSRRGRLQGRARRGATG